MIDRMEVFPEPLFPISKTYFLHIRNKLIYEQGTCFFLLLHFSSLNEKRKKKVNVTLLLFV